jgi:D-tyrosyl-tRNA(Tyr) deacylase
MRAVIQLTDRSAVEVDGKQIAAIGPGLTVLLGVGAGDGEQDVKYLVEKIVNLRIFPDDAGKMNLSLRDVNGELLVISQFTLYGDCRKGRRPGFDLAAPPEQAKKLYETFVRLCEEQGVKTKHGQFQAEMIVKLENHGPVTIMLDSNRLF